MTVDHANDDQRHGRPGLTPELLDVEQVATLCQFSPRHVLRMANAGKMPSPLKVGRCVRWSRRAIETWIADGCRGSSRRPG